MCDTLIIFSTEICISEFLPIKQFPVSNRSKLHPLLCRSARSFVIVSEFQRYESGGVRKFPALFLAR